MATAGQASSSGISLKWPDFTENLMHQYELLIEEEHFVDVTLVCEGKQFKAHKVVLSASSSYLSSLLKDNPCTHPVIILDDELRASCLSAVLSFIYTGQVQIASNEVEMFLQAARLLDLRAVPQVQVMQDSFPLSRQEIKMESNEMFEEMAATASNADFSSAQSHVSNHYQESPETLLSFEGGDEEEKEEGGKATTNPRASSSSIGKSHNVAGFRRHSLEPRPCPVCGNFYSNLSNLRQHLKLIHNPTLVRCTICSRTFKTALYLRRHIMGFHEVTPSAAASLSTAANSNNSLTQLQYHAHMSHP